MKKILVLIFILVFSSYAGASDEYGEVDIHGFIAQGYLKSTDYDFFHAKTEDGTFEFNELGLNFSTDLTDSLRMGIQLFAKDLGILGNDEVVIDWAYADYKYQNWLGLRVGKMKKPSGQYNQVRDIDSTRTCIFLPTSTYNDVYRDSLLATKGVGLYGYLPFGFEYQATYGIFDLPVDGGMALKALDALHALDPEVTIDSSDVEASCAVSLAWNTPLDGLRLFGFNDNSDFTLYTSNPSLASINVYSNVFGSGLEYTYGNLLISGEYVLHKRRINVEGIANDKIYSDNYYLYVTYRFTDWFEAGSYYSTGWENKHDRDGDNITDGPKEKAWLKDLALSLRFDINDYWICKLEGHYMDGLMDVDYGDNPDPDKNWFLFAGKVSYSF